VDAGHIQNYDHCMNCSPVTSTWRPLAGTTPFIGNEGELSVEPEIKVEVCCLAENIDATLAAAKAAHPYEVPVINVIPLWRTGY